MTKIISPSGLGAKRGKGTPRGEQRGGRERGKMRRKLFAQCRGRRRARRTRRWRRRRPLKIIEFLSAESCARTHEAGARKRRRRCRLHFTTEWTAREEEREAQDRVDGRRRRNSLLSRPRFRPFDRVDQNLVLEKYYRVATSYQLIGCTDELLHNGETT